MDLHLKRIQEQFNLPIVLLELQTYMVQVNYYIEWFQKLFAFLKRQKMIIHGNGQSLRSFIHIDDVSIATSLVLLKGKVGETYHISNIEGKISIKSLIKKIAKISKVDFDKNVYFTNDRVGKDEIYDLNYKKISSSLNWKPKIGLNEGLLETKTWIKNNFATFKNLPTVYKHKK